MGWRTPVAAAIDLDGVASVDLDDRAWDGWIVGISIRRSIWPALATAGAQYRSEEETEKVHQECELRHAKKSLNLGS